MRIEPVDGAAVRTAFAHSLRTRREVVGLWQERAGAAARIHRTEVSRRERAVREPRLSTLVALARALETTPSELLREIV